MGGGGKHFSKTFSIFYVLNSKTEFSTYIFNWYLFFEKHTFADNLSVDPTILFMEKMSFSLNLFSGHFYGQNCSLRLSNVLAQGHNTKPPVSLKLVAL